MNQIRNHWVSCSISLIGCVLAWPGQAATVTSIQSGNWSDPATWDTVTVPALHDTVEIAEEHTVIYDTLSDDVIDLLTVNGTLQFSTVTDTKLTLDEAAVYGTWQIATAEQPLPRSVTAEVSITGQTEQLAFYDAIFSVHGAGNDRTWTRLAATAKRGSKRLKLKQSVDWQVGDTIVIAATSYQAEEAETRTITAVSDNKKVLQLGSALDYKHYGSHHEFAEVGLLSHNVQFSGDETYDAGHIIFNGNSVVTIHSATFDTLGTYATLAQYPLHFHLVGNGTGSSIKKTAIVNSGNRCITIHGTNNVLIQDNVAYNTKGHCYFLEDGVEQDNQFIHNLGADTQPGATLDSDAEPATFWITNPQNTFQRNAAAGSAAFGYWFFLLEEATGLSSDSDIVPRTLRLQHFTHNTTHSNGARGLTIDGEGYDSVYYMPTKRAVFKNITAYKNASTGIWARGRDLTFTKATLLDNRIGASFAASDTRLTHSLVIGESGNDSTEGWMPYKYGFAFYDGPVQVKHTTFKQFHSSDDKPQAGVSLQPNNPYQMSPNSSFADLKFYDARNFFIDDVTRAGDMFAVLNNADTGQVVLPLLDFHNGSGCNKKTEWNVYVCDHIDYGRLVFSDGREKHYTTELTITRLDTAASIDLVEEGSSSGGRFVMNVPSQLTYRLSKGNINGLTLQFDKAADSVTVRVPYENAPSLITELGLEHDYWTYDTDTNEVVLELRPDREYKIYK